MRIKSEKWNNFENDQTHMENVFKPDFIDFNKSVILKNETIKEV